MKTVFKPLALASAVAAVSAGYTGTASAQWVAPNGLGDLALIPYYTVENGFTTGFVVTNTSDFTQVVKVRLRRASDSSDALDINLVMSPKDVWAANIRDEDGTIILATDDETCTVPAGNAGKGRFQMSPLYRAGAEEGYIEIIGMGRPTFQDDLDNGTSDLDGDSDENTAIAQAAKHVNGVPRDCGAVRENFFSQNTPSLDDEGVTQTEYGNFDYDRTRMEWWEDLDDVGDEDIDTNLVEIDYDAPDDVLRVSYLIRNTASGVEFGNEAVHIADFVDDAAMSNQQYGLFAGDLSGFDYPDLNGGMPTYPSPISDDDTSGSDGFYNPIQGSTPAFGFSRDKYEDLRDALGVDSVLNDWSTNPALGVTTDWVVTFPGQYVMTDYYLWNAQLFGQLECGEENPDDDSDDISECDFRDLPIRAQFSGADSGTWDREEATPDQGEGGLVVSPSIPGASIATKFENEVNVVEWTDGGSSSAVLDSSYSVEVNTGALGIYGWAQLSVSSDNNNSESIADGNRGAGGGFPNGDAAVTAPAICNWPINGISEDIGLDNPLPQQTCTDVSNSDIPMVGFVAWQRSFPETPDRNYGRIVEHAWTS